MILRTVLRDCLYLNWALPVEKLAEPPPPLRYESHCTEQGEFVFGSALLFRQVGLHTSSAKAVKLSYPQFNFRLYVVDEDGTPAVLFRCVLVPSWVVPGARLVAKQPAAAGHFKYPRPSKQPELPEWRWSVRKRSRLVLAAHPASPKAGSGPSLGSWEQTVHYFRNRPVGYFESASGLRRVETVHPRAVVWPLAVEFERQDLLADCLAGQGGSLDSWPELHSAWLCPEIPLNFEFLGTKEHALAHQLPAPG